MTLNELSGKNGTSKAVCVVLGGRQRNRPEPLAIKRLEQQVRSYMTVNSLKFNRGEFFVCIKDLSESGQVSIVNNRMGRPKSLEFKRTIAEFKKELDMYTVVGGENKTVKIELPSHTIPKAMRTKFIIEVVGGKATIEIEGDVEQVMRRLRAML